MDANRVNIPAVCRIPGKGTAFLVSQGILMTTLSVIGSKQEASRLKAVFFENSKQPAVTVDLKPYTFFFSSAFPDYLDYCIVACDTKNIFNVKPVKLPLVLPEIIDVEEGDTCLIVQHPLPLDATVAADGSTRVIDQGPVPPEEVKVFAQVQRKRADILHFKTSTQHNNAGSPVFNEKGQLVGLHSQMVRECEGSVSRAIHIGSIVRHLFANSMLGKIAGNPTFDQVWKSWFVPGDATSAIKIIQNFPYEEIRQRAIIELCSLTQERSQVGSFVKCGGTKVLLDNLQLFRNEEDLVKAGLRALWNVSFGDEDNTQEIISNEGVPLVVSLMEKFHRSEDVSEYGNVLLYNVTLKVVPENTTADVISIVVKAMQQFRKKEVVLKFGYGALSNICRNEVQKVPVAIREGAVDILLEGMEAFPGNEYLNEHAVSFVRHSSKHEEFLVHPRIRDVIQRVISAMQKFGGNKTIVKHGNHALWNLGTHPANRMSIRDAGGLQVLADTMDVLADDVYAASWR
eukprot:TRINITY_DN9217_c0_g2_i4.p1 TRINITY_DN9217_c0_g2~~TRINITY_DN9217_c0_g2_i4.p1  ORF type:complete len:514 (+),score=97.66 TRINITY_DN9217_c0_g2_i4:42-1583(+)